MDGDSESLPSTTMHRLLLALLALHLPLALSCASPTTVDEPAVSAEDQAAIEGVIRSAYIDGVFVKRDPELVRAGFATTFVFNSYWNGALSSRTLDEWLERLKLDGVPRERDVRADIAVVERTGVAAVARIDVHLDSVHTYTDYFCLYDTEDGWKIVTKIFHGHS